MRIRRKTAPIPPESVVFDLDGTIIDQRPVYQALAKARGYAVSGADVNYNRLRERIPPDILATLDAAYLGDGTKNAPAMPGALEVLRDYSTSAYIVTARGTEYERPGRSWLQRNLPVFPADHVFVFPSTPAKGRFLSELEVALVVDDQIAPLKAVPAEIARYLFDPDGAFPDEGVAGLKVVRSWDAIRALIAPPVQHRGVGLPSDS